MAEIPHPPNDPSGALDTGAAHPRTAVRWMWLLVAGVAAAAFMADRDSRNRERLEVAVERTAVGDRLYLPLEQKSSLRFEGAPLVAAEAPEPQQESRMVFAGTVEGVAYRLYLPRERADADGAGGAPSWWVKTGPGQFLRVSQ
jgi:hypothetical protein